MELTDKLQEKGDHLQSADLWRFGTRDAFKRYMRKKMYEMMMNAEGKAPGRRSKKMNSWKYLLTTSRVIYILARDLTAIYR
jgi:hypothetical protein